MNLTHITAISGELGLTPEQVEATGLLLELLEGGATIPFIARYRKEVTGSLDEVQIAAIRDRKSQLEELDKRRETILASLIERDLLTDELKEAVLTAETLAKLEDIYLPYRPKLRTRATIALEKGLEPLAEALRAQDAENAIDPEAEAAHYIDEDKGVASADEALSGARDIIAEWVNEDQTVRSRVRELFRGRGRIVSHVSNEKRF